MESGVRSRGEDFQLRRKLRFSNGQFLTLRGLFLLFIWIFLENDDIPTKKMQRRLNPTMKEVVRDEVIKIIGYRNNLHHFR